MPPSHLSKSLSASSLISHITISSLCCYFCSSSPPSHSALCQYICSKIAPLTSNRFIIQQGHLSRVRVCVCLIRSRRMGQAQNGTGVMAEQMEIHPGRNDVINAAESTFLLRMGKSLLCGISFYSNGLGFAHIGSSSTRTLEVHPRGKKKPCRDSRRSLSRRTISRFLRTRLGSNNNNSHNLPNCHVCNKCQRWWYSASCGGGGLRSRCCQPTGNNPGGPRGGGLAKANPISVLITNDELMALMPLTREPTPKST